MRAKVKDSEKDDDPTKMLSPWCCQRFVRSTLVPCRWQAAVSTESNTLLVRTQASAFLSPHNHNILNVNYS